MNNAHKEGREAKLSNGWIIKKMLKGKVWLEKKMGKSRKSCVHIIIECC